MENYSVVTCRGEYLSFGFFNELKKSRGEFEVNKFLLIDKILADKHYLPIHKALKEYKKLYSQFLAICTTCNTSDTDAADIIFPDTLVKENIPDNYRHRVNRDLKEFMNLYDSVATLAQVETKIHQFISKIDASIFNLKRQKIEKLILQKDKIGSLQIGKMQKNSDYTQNSINSFYNCQPNSFHVDVEIQPFVDKWSQKNNHSANVDMKSAKMKEFLFTIDYLNSTDALLTLGLSLPFRKIKANSVFSAKRQDYAMGQVSAQLVQQMKVYFIMLEDKSRAPSLCYLKQTLDNWSFVNTLQEATLFSTSQQAIEYLKEVKQYEHKPRYIVASFDIKVDTLDIVHGKNSKLAQKIETLDTKQKLENALSAQRDNKMGYKI